MVIVHVEIQREREPNFPYRMWQYYTLLRQRESLPVVPIALVFYAGREGIAYEGYEEAVFGHTVLTFRYLQISLPLLSAEEYVQSGSVLGAGLSSVMKLPSTREGRIALYLASLRRVLDAEQSGEVDEARAFLLGNLVETYSPLDDEERDALRVQLEEGGDATMEVTELTWADRIALRTMRKSIRDLVQIRLGSVSPEVEAQINATDSEEDLTALFRRAALAQAESKILQGS